MKFKRYHGFIQIVVFSFVLISVISWGMLTVFLCDHLFDNMTEKDTILLLLSLVLIPFLDLFLCSWVMSSHIRFVASQHGGHSKDEIEMDSEGIRLHSRKAGDMFLPWENVFEILEIRRARIPFEIVVRGIDGDINFFGNAIARRYIKKKIGFKIQKAPGNWRERSDWRNKYDTNKM